MARDANQYSDTREQEKLDYLVERPSLEEHLEELKAILDSPGRYPRNQSPAFNGTNHFDEGSILKSEALAEDAQSQHSYSPIQRELTAVLEAAAHHAGNFNEQERLDLATAIVEHALKDQAAAFNASLTYLDEAIPPQQAAVGYAQHVGQLVEIVQHSIDPDYWYRPYEAAKDITSFAREDQPGLGYLHQERFDLMKFEAKCARYAQGDASDRDYMINQHFNELFNPKLGDNGLTETYTLRALKTLHFNDMERAFEEGDQALYEAVSQSVQQARQLMQYAADRNSFESYQITRTPMTYEVGPQAAEIFRENGAAWLEFNQQIQQIADHNVREIAQAIHQYAYSTIFTEDGQTSWMGPHVALSEFINAAKRREEAQQEYVQQGDLYPDAYFTHLNVDTAYLYQHAFDQPDRETPEASRYVYDCIANQYLHHLKYAQEVGDAARFRELLDQAAEAAQFANAHFDFSQLDFYADGAHNDRTHHTPEYVAALIEETYREATQALDALPDHPANDIARAILEEAVYHATFLAMDEQPAEQADFLSGPARYEEGIFRLRAARQAAQDLTRFHGANTG